MKKISVKDLKDNCLILLENGLYLRYIGNVDLLNDKPHLFRVLYSPFATTEWIKANHGQISVWSGVIVEPKQPKLSN